MISRGIAILVFLGLGVTALALVPKPAVAGAMSLEAHATDAGIVIHFTYVEDPAHPTGHPEWTMYEVEFCAEDQPLPACTGGSGCGAIAYYPRTGGTDDITFLYTVPSGLRQRELNITVFAIDRFYNRLFLDASACQPCAAGDLAGYPLATTVAAYGTLTAQDPIGRDLGGDLLLNPCNSCGPYLLVREPWATTLRPLAGTGQGLLLYGEINSDWAHEQFLGIDIDHYVLFACTSPVPVRGTSWGTLKSIYR